MLCGSANLIGHGQRVQQVMDFPHQSRYTCIHLTRKRYRCKECCGTFFHPLAWLDDDHLATKRFVDKIAELALERSFSALSREYGINEKTVRNIFYGRYKDDIDTTKFTQPEYMGIDEIDVAGGARGVVTNLSNNTAIDEGLFDQDLSSILRADAQPRCLQGRFNGLHSPLKEPDTSAIPQGQGGGRQVPYPAHGRPGGRWRSLAGQE